MVNPLPHIITGVRLGIRNSGAATWNVPLVVSSHLEPGQAMRVRR